MQRAAGIAAALAVALIAVGGFAVLSQPVAELPAQVAPETAPAPPPSSPTRPAPGAISVEVKGAPKGLTASPDGRTLAYESFRMAGPTLSTLVIQSDALLLEPTNARRPSTLEPHFDPDGSLTYIGLVDGALRVHRAGTPISDLPGPAEGLSLNEDGAVLAVTVGGDLGIVRDGVAEVIATPGHDVLTVLHPEGDPVLLVRKSPGLQLVERSLATGEERLFGPGEQTLPAYADQHILFYEKQGATWSLVASKGADRTVLGTRLRLPRRADTAVSPDQRWVASFSESATLARVLLLDRVDGSEHREVRIEGLEGTDPCFVPGHAGWRIAYTASTEHGRGIFLMDLSTVLGPAGWIHNPQTDDAP